MVNRLHAIQFQSGGKPICWRDVYDGAIGEPAAHRSKKQHAKTLRGSITLAIAGEAFVIAASHVMTWTGRLGGLEKELSVRTNGLKTVVFDHHGRAQDEGKE